jgi:hypothetical protein
VNLCVCPRVNIVCECESVIFLCVGYIIVEISAPGNSAFSRLVYVSMSTRVGINLDWYLY